MRLLTTLVLLLTMTACARTETVRVYCPPLPTAGPLVAAELETLDGEYPHLWSWIGKLEQYKRVCEKSNGTVQ